MAKAKKNNGKRKSQSQGVEIPTMMGTVTAMDKQAPNMGVEAVRGRVPRRRVDPKITPKFRRLK